MARWTIDQSTTRTLDGIVALRVRIVGGLVNVLPTDDPVTFEVSDIVGGPVLVSQEAGILTITYEDLTREGLLDRLRPPQLTGYRDVGRRSATISLRVPTDCPIDVTTVTAPIVAAGVRAKTRLRSASGDVTLDGLGGEIDVNTVSGGLEARGLSGSLGFNSVSGRLAVAGDRLSAFSAKSGSGQLFADVDLTPSARVRLASVSGDIALRVPAETSANVDLRTATGALDSAFGLERRDQRGRSRLSGTIGSGIEPADVTTTTVSGSVSLLRRAPDAPAALLRGDA
ncbi:DUF4097 family beta strand repeat-containing protein [Marinactinospora thermotolerans]|uniref:DUF4097 and DUF4098 domain-containing protein YvlB n=1 Tax=Marinactinospora thermotolerans DSM 45154 TaxID=1122192 RepID=A0A1T4SDI9_9ACTN|nr:DUF4097 family beta strand repeat-containing protein [Marinactinospora thermotolerans]SKA26292.1 DUF4097 and DUF4098 domain-containing protein YvlB [Marinactinospora thermotolerans DSM 45154]